MKSSWMSGEKHKQLADTEKEAVNDSAIVSAASTEMLAFGHELVPQPFNKFKRVKFNVPGAWRPDAKGAETKAS